MRLTSFFAGKQIKQLVRDFDVVFMMDSTSEIDPYKYQLQKEYVKSLARSLSLSSDSTRAGLVIYSNVATIKSRLEYYSSLRGFEQEVEQAEYLGGKRAIDKALGAAARVLSSGRPNAKKLAILITAGRQTQSGSRALNDAARPLRSIGARLYIVGIGGGVDPNELRPALLGPDDLIQVPSFTGLPSKAQNTINRVLGITGLFFNFFLSMCVGLLCPQLVAW